MNGEAFKVTDTPRELDTFSADVEAVSAEWTPDGFVLYFETSTAEGYSVPVRLQFEGAPLDDLREHVAGS